MIGIKSVTSIIIDLHDWNKERNPSITDFNETSIIIDLHDWNKEWNLYYYWPPWLE